MLAVRSQKKSFTEQQAEESSFEKYLIWSFKLFLNFSLDIKWTKEQLQNR